MSRTRLIPGAGVALVARAGSALLLAMSAAAAPSSQSGAQIDACLEESGAARVCSSKELSNVVLQCGDESGSVYIKFDDLDDTESPYEGLLSPNEGLFSCPEGELLAVFVKSGSGKYDGEPIEGLPPGSGAQFSPLACSVEPVDCETADEGDEGGDEGGEEAEPQE
jgi:hypothetical protein